MMRCDIVPALESYLKGWSSREFEWGEADCARFAAGWVHNCMGNDPLFGFADYDSEEGALAALSQAGFATLADAVSARLEPHASAMEARRGDIVQARKGGALGICTGAGADFMLAGQKGLVRLPLGACARAWKVEF